MAVYNPNPVMEHLGRLRNKYMDLARYATSSSELDRLAEEIRAVEYHIHQNLQVQRTYNLRDSLEDRRYYDRIYSCKEVASYRATVSNKGLAKIIWTALEINKVDNTTVESIYVGRCEDNKLHLSSSDIVKDWHKDYFFVDPTDEQVKGYLPANQYSPFAINWSMP